MSDSILRQHYTKKDLEKLPLSFISPQIQEAAVKIHAAAKCPDSTMTRIRSKAASDMFHKGLTMWKRGEVMALPVQFDDKWFNVLVSQAVAWGRLLYPEKTGIDRALLVSLLQSEGVIDEHVMALLQLRMRDGKIADMKKVVERLALHVAGFNEAKSRIIKADEHILIEAWSGNKRVPPIALMTNKVAAIVHSALFQAAYGGKLSEKTDSDFIRFKRKLGLTSCSPALKFSVERTSRGLRLVGCGVDTILTQ